MDCIYRLLDGVDCAVNRFTEVLIGYPPLVRLGRKAVLSLLSNISIGKLTVRTRDNVYQFGRDGASDVELTVLNDGFWARLFLSGDLGFAAAYMEGEAICDDLVAVFKIFIANRENLNEASTWPSSIFSAMDSLVHFRFINSTGNAFTNISAHYDISNEIFSAFLSEDMTYSCAIFKNQDDSLETAQYYKLDCIIRQARIQRDDHVLEIGSGWGSFAIRAVQQTGCKVTTLTLSPEQKNLAEERIRAAGLEHEITVLLCDYRQHNAVRKYDKVIALEMIEHVGAEFLDTFFSKVNEYLKNEGGIAVFQLSTVPETRYEKYRKGVDFMQKWIFPGGHCPSVTRLIAAINSGSKGALVVDRLINVGGHYTATLRMWRERFLDNFEDKIIPALRRRAMNEGDIFVFKRMWEVFQPKIELTKVLFCLL